MGFTNYADVSAGYANLWAKAQIRPERLGAVNAIALGIARNKARYSRVSPSIPWWFVGIVHHLESGGNFATHLHNGDPLTRRTIHVPAGRPLAGAAPFVWEMSAFDAMDMKGLTHETDWSPAKACWNFERYNGFGYTVRGINSPYVWSFSSLYARGKYIADGVFSASAVSQQCGAAAILKVILSTAEEVGVPPLDVDLPLPPIHIPVPNLPAVIAKPKPAPSLWTRLWQLVFKG